MTAARAHIAAMAAYQLADLTPPEGRKLISLCQNESLRPPSPLALEAAAEAMAASMLYPDPDWMALREAIGELHHLPPDRILCGNGSLELIGALARAYAGPDRAVLAPVHAYPFFRTAAQLAEARFDTAAEQDLTVDVSNLLASVRPDTGIVFVANPGNPTGTRIARSELNRLRNGLRDDILLVIDEAYGEFDDLPGETSFDLLTAGNTVVLRTFSKAYGMAGFRVGWGLFPQSASAEIRKVLNPNNISLVAQAAAAAAIRDQDYMKETCRLVEKIRTQATRDLRGAGFRVPDSFTNFVLIDLENETRARQADQALRRQGIFLRGQAGAGLPHMLRMTIGPEADVGVSVSELIKWKGEQR
ncbi:MAG: aminotransferase class I/II-fold pyridoxal phosphate-dependent enzyme [Nitratireductor sp.]|nr:aminotransferase class I/II-fold pyridoxal phosphate-dependent enzyme [Nitratireductor sp.]